MEIKPSRTITINYHQICQSNSSNPIAWLVYCGCPPTTAYQEPLGCSITANNKEGPIKGTVYREQTGLQRQYMEVTFLAPDSSVTNGYSVDMFDCVRLSSRHLVPGVVDDPKSIEPLTKSDRQAYLASNSHIYWSSGPLHDWINQRGLMKRTDESDIAFAWRIANVIQKDFHYVDNRNSGDVAYDVGDVCRNKFGDCVGISQVIIGVLRANNIPSRLDQGVWLLKPPDDHARLEFYSADAGGWVPMDGARLVSSGSNWQAGFGDDEADFVTIMLDTDIGVNTHISGIQPITNLSNPHCWIANVDSTQKEIYSRTITAAYSDYGPR